MLSKVISGGQTGADLGALVAAKLCGIPTGGFMPKGFRTQNGARPEYAKHFGLQEHESFSYKDRTWDNVYNSDATMRIACNISSAGEKCTLNAIKSYGKPHLDIEFDKNNPTIELYQIDSAINWLRENKVAVLNVAGNSHKTWSGMQYYAVTFLTHVFIELGFTRTIFTKEFS